MPGYKSFFHDAERKGYAGVAIYTRHEPTRIVRGFGVPEFDSEGRYIEVQLGELSVISLYMPSGSAGPERQASKYRFLEAFAPYLARLRRRRRDYIICGDWNIAHKNIDLQELALEPEELGLPARRARVAGSAVRPRRATWTRSARSTRQAEQYTWWSNRGQARAKNVGWRIDYQVVSKSLAGQARTAYIYKDSWFSDHAPLIMDYEIPQP